MNTSQRYMGVVDYRPGDTSVDTSRNNIQDEADLSEPSEVHEIFGQIGQDTQGPAGAPIPDLDDETMRPAEFEEIPDVADSEYHYRGDLDAPQDAFGPEPLLGPMGSFTAEELVENPEAAAAAAVAAKMKNSATTDMLNTMEDAEAVSEATEGVNNMDITAIKRDPQAVEQKYRESRERLRPRVLEKLVVALQNNIAIAASSQVPVNPVALAVQIEELVFCRCHTFANYQSVCANVIGDAVKVLSVDQLLQIAATGVIQQPSTADAPPLEDASGLQGIAWKPE